MRFCFIDLYLKKPPVVAREYLPAGMKILVDEMVTKGSQEEMIYFVYESLAKKYRGYRTLTYLRLDRLWITDAEALWRIQGFLHCHHMNYLLRTLLVAGGKFAPEVIETRWTHIWFLSPHQYLSVLLSNGKKVAVDLWARAYGVPFGEYAHGFQSGSLFAKIEK
jgi:hypothetical protein